MNIAKMMAQAKAMQSEMDKAQKEINALCIEGHAKNGLVTVVLKGDGTMEDLSIAPDILANHQDMVAELVMMAYGDAFAKINTAKANIMQRVQGGMPSLPF